MGKPVIEPLEPGWFLVSDGTNRWRVAAATEGGRTWVFVDGQVAVIEEEQTTRRKKGGGDASLMSPMPATVVAIKAEAGQSVSDGETLIVLEAMKMELPIKAPRAGVVKAVNCKKGDLVQPGVSLLELE